jgi:hypothetical protein
MDIQWNNIFNTTRVTCQVQLLAWTGFVEYSLFKCILLTSFMVCQILLRLTSGIASGYQRDVNIKDSDFHRWHHLIFYLLCNRYRWLQFSETIFSGNIYFQNSRGVYIVIIVMQHIISNFTSGLCCRCSVKFGSFCVSCQILLWYSLNSRITPNCFGYFDSYHYYKRWPSLSLSCKHTKQSISKSTKEDYRRQILFDKQHFFYANHMHKWNMHWYRHIRYVPT